jgi:hypothetical protein
MGVFGALALGVDVLLHALPRVICAIYFLFSGLFALWCSYCLALPRVLGWLYILFSLTPVRGGTYFLCCAKESKQRKALHTANPKCPPTA